VSDGLPLSVQVYADLWHDDRVLDAAEVLETAFGVITPIDPR
jgi:Asp-tRNA(Asn)/Glu-tRNA(Gln) amidotransferase A subunit family amidase